MRNLARLYMGLDKLAADLVDHIHTENNVLFPVFTAQRHPRTASAMKTKHLTPHLVNSSAGAQREAITRT